MCCHYPSLLSWNNVFKLCFKANIFFVVNVPSEIWVGKILKSECIQNLNALFSYNIVVVNEVVQGVCECQDLHFRNCRTALPFFFRGIRFLTFWFRGENSLVFTFSQGRVLSHDKILSAWSLAVCSAALTCLN